MVVEGLFSQGHALLFGIGHRVILEVEVNGEGDLVLLDHLQALLGLLLRARDVNGIAEPVDPDGDAGSVGAACVLVEAAIGFVPAIARPDDGELDASCLDLAPVQDALELRDVDAFDVCHWFLLSVYSSGSSWD